MGNIFTISMGGGFWIGLVVCILAEYKRKKNHPLTTSYKWGYFNVGYLFGFYITFWSNFLEKNLYLELTPIHLCLLAGWTATALICAYHIYYRRQLAWIIGTILSLNWILFVINAIYLSKYWNEISPQSEILPKIIVSEEKTLNVITSGIPSGCTEPCNFIKSVTLEPVTVATEETTEDMNTDRKRLERELAKPIESVTWGYAVFISMSIAGAILLYSTTIINGINRNWESDIVIVFGILSLIIASISIILYIVKTKRDKTEDKTINFKRGFLHLTLILSIIAAPILTIIIAFSENRWHSDEAIALIVLGPIAGFILTWVLYTACQFIIVPIVQYILDMFNINYTKNRKNKQTN